MKTYLNKPFSEQQIITLKEQFGGINSINPSSETYKKLVASLEKFDKKTLQYIATLNIKWMSMLAKNRANGLVAY